MPPTAAATAPPVSSSRSTTATEAPSLAKRSHIALPMPLAPPVTTATRSTSRCAYGMVSSLMSILLRFFPLALFPVARFPLARFPRCGLLRADEDVLDVAERLERVGTELAPDPGLLGPAERRPVAHRRVRVDRERPRLHR